MIKAARGFGLARVALALIALQVGCELGDALPPTPAQTAAADGRALEGQLRAQLDALPGLRRAAIAIAVPARDPLAPRRSTGRPRVAVTLVVGADADRDGLRVAASAAATALVGADADLTVTVLGAPPPRASSRRRAAAIAAALAVAAAATALALAFARRRYRGTRPQ